MRAPDLFTAFIDDGVLVGVDIIGESAGRCSPKVGEELVLSVERDNREWVVQVTGQR